MTPASTMQELWFDVGIKRYTTLTKQPLQRWKLWFDVGIKGYTTSSATSPTTNGLWFDVGFKRYRLTRQSPWRSTQTPTIPI